MANIKITDLDAYADPKSTDVLPAVDVTNDQTKKVSIADLMENAGSGTEAAPGIAFDGDPNTGIYRPGADQLAISTGGTQRLLISDTGAVTIPGDLTVQGTTTTIDTTNLIVEDKNIEMGSVTTPTDTTADGGGITLKGATDKTLNWVNATDSWTSSENVDLASGKTYKINGTDVLSATALGSAVQISSDNIPSGTIVNDDVNASAAIAGTKIDPDFGSQTVETTGVFSAAGGAQGTPSITFTGDLNTGIYSPGADQVAISTGGTGRLFVDSSGNVQLETGALRLRGSGNSISADQTTATYLRFNVNSVDAFDVQRISTSGAQLKVNQFSTGATAANYPVFSNFDDSDTGMFFPDSSNTVGFSTGGNERLRITSTGEFEFTGAGTAGTNQAVYFSGSAPINSLFINSAGNVGLGTASPSSVLHVANAQSGVGGAFIDARTTGTGEGLLISANTRGSADDATALLRVINRSGTDALRVNVAGNVGLGTNNPTHDLTIGSTAASDFVLALRGGVGGFLGWDDSANCTILQAPNTRSLQFRVNSDTFSAGTMAMHINSSGNVGIGTTAPSSELEISSADPLVTLNATGTGETGLLFESNGNERGKFYWSSNGETGFEAGIAGNVYYHKWTLNGLERARIDSNGRLLVGATLARSNLNNVGQSAAFQLEGASNSTNKALIVSNFNSATDAVPAGLYLARAGSTGAGSTVVVDADNQLGEVAFLGSDGTDFVQAAQIKAEVDGTPGANDMPGRLVFSTTADGASSPTERMRIVSNGRLDLYSTDEAAYGQFARMVRFGYGSPYKCLMLGGTETANYTSISLGYNVGNNASGNFNGDGREIVVRNNSRIISPNATDDGYLPNIYFNMAGHGTINSYGGIAFGTDTASTNVLDDYEEGTFTVTTNANLTLDSSYTTWAYTKIGRQVTIAGLVKVSSVSGTNAVTGSLPFFSASNPSSGNASCAGGTMHSGVDTGDAGLAWYISGGGANTFTFYRVYDNGGWDQLPNSALAAGDEIYATMTYFTS